MIISDTLTYRPDGTISGVTRMVRETYETPSGRSMTEDVSTTVSLSEVTELADRGYADLATQNEALEQQIVTEREASAADKAQALQALAASHAVAINQLIAEKDAEKAAAIAGLEERPQ